MKNKQDIEKAAMQTLHSLDNLQQVEANDYLYAKIRQRIMDNRVLPMVHNKVMLRLAAVLVLFIGLNCVSFYVLKQHNETTAHTSTGANAFANAYSLNNNQDSY